MRKLVALGGLAAIVWWLRGRHAGEVRTRATLGYDDGSSLTLDTGAPELDNLLRIARGALRQ
jgi:hypothetical protein